MLLLSIGSRLYYFLVSFGWLFLVNIIAEPWNFSVRTIMIVNIRLSVKFGVSRIVCIRTVPPPLLAVSQTFMSVIRACRAQRALARASRLASSAREAAGNMYRSVPEF